MPTVVGNHIPPAEGPGNANSSDTTDSIDTPVILQQKLPPTAIDTSAKQRQQQQSTATADVSNVVVYQSPQEPDDPSHLGHLPDEAPYTSMSYHDREQSGHVFPAPIQNQAVKTRQHPLPNTDTTKEGVTKNPTTTVEPDLAEAKTSDLLLVIPTHYVFIFANPRSGNQQGDPLVKLNIQHYRLRTRPHVQVQIYNFIDDAERSAGLKYLRLLLSKPWDIKEVHVWSAGGDGTLMGVVEGMVATGIDVKDERVRFSVVPFGTGNDLSQVLGWGRFVSGKDVAGHHLEGLNEMVEDRLDGTPVNLDVWEVSIETGEGGWIRQAGKDSKLEFLKRKMSNYSSIGIQGKVGAGFEENRRGTRVLNAIEYAKQSFHLLTHGAPRVNESVKGIEFEGKVFEIGHRRNLTVRKAPVELIIQNISGMWGRQVDLWGTAHVSPSIVRDASGPTDVKTWTPNTAYDAKLEIFGISSLKSYLEKQLPWGRSSLQRVGQFPSPLAVVFKPRRKLHAMIDGEFYELYNPTRMTFKQLMQITLMGPNDPEKSRLVRDEVERRAELPGPTGEGTEPGVDFELHKPEEGLSEEELAERRSINTMSSCESSDSVEAEAEAAEEEKKKDGGEKGASTS